MKAKEILESDARNNSWFHAYLLVAPDLEKAHELVDFVVKERNFDPFDVTVIDSSGESGKSGDIKIVDIRRFLHEINLSPRGSGRLAVIYSCESLNSSSANILLKTLEEPPKNVMFILVSTTANLMPTIVSRCRLIKAEEGENTGETATFDITFLSNGFAKSSKRIDEIIKSGETVEFLAALEKKIRNGLAKSFKPAYGYGIREILQARREIRSNANARLVLENLMLRLENLLKLEETC